MVDEKSELRVCRGWGMGAGAGGRRSELRVCFGDWEIRLRVSHGIIKDRRDTRRLYYFGTALGMLGICILAPLWRFSLHIGRETIHEGWSMVIHRPTCSL